MRKRIFEIINFLAALFVITTIALLTAYLISNKIDDINGKDKKEKTEKKFISKET